MRRSVVLLMCVVWLNSQPNDCLYGQETTLSAVADDPFAQSGSTEYYVPDTREQSSPGLIVKQNAADRAAQRRQRIASYKWLGISKQRPPAQVTPWFGTSNYSPVFGGWNPYAWTSLYPASTRVYYLYTTNN